MTRPLLAIALCLMLVASNAYACDSYQECMDKSEPQGIYNPLENQIYAQKAIAYKLDEISKKLDKK